MAINYYKKLKSLKNQFPDPSKIKEADFKKVIMIEFGFTYPTCKKWINNYLDTGLIEYTDHNFIKIVD